MGTDNLHHKKKKGSLSRKGKKKSVNPYILIVCEGKRTEPNYFEWYKNNCKQFIEVNVEGLGSNTLSLVEDAIRIKKKEEKKWDITFDQVWCVYDRDSFPINNYLAAYNLAKKQKIFIAHSNECFELWYLLHFNYYTNSMDRNIVCKKLDEIMKDKFNKPYIKNDPTMFKLLESRQITAIRNAKKLESNNSELAYYKKNPSTTVYKLVEELNKYRK